MQEKKLKLEDIVVQSFVTSNNMPGSIGNIYPQMPVAYDVADITNRNPTVTVDDTTITNRNDNTPIGGNRTLVQGGCNATHPTVVLPPDFCDTKVERQCYESQTFGWTGTFICKASAHQTDCKPVCPDPPKGTNDYRVCPAPKTAVGQTCQACPSKLNKDRPECGIVTQKTCLTQGTDKTKPCDPDLETRVANHVCVINQTGPDTLIGGDCLFMTTGQVTFQYPTPDTTP